MKILGQAGSSTLIVEMRADEIANVVGKSYADSEFQRTLTSGKEFSISPAFKVLKFERDRPQLLKGLEDRLEEALRQVQSARADIETPIIVKED